MQISGRPEICAVALRGSHDFVLRAPQGDGANEGIMMDVLMPQLGETVAEGKITKWFKAAGDKVAPGDNL